MPKNKRRKPKAESTNLRSIILKILVGSALNVILYSALCVIFSLVSLKADFDLSMYKYFIFAISAVSGFFGGFKSVGAIRKNGLLFGALSALPALLIIFLVASIISRTGIAVSGRISAIIMTVFSALGGIVSANKRR